jgi:hypothetical protein
MRDFRDAKAMAQTLRDALKAKSVTLTNSESLELIATRFSRLERAECQDSGGAYSQAYKDDPGKLIIRTASSGRRPATLTASGHRAVSVYDRADLR